MKNKLFIVAVVFLSIFIVKGCTAQEINPEITFTWTAPGDDSTEGTASKYELRYATDSLLLINSWNTATKIPDTLLPVPEIAGTFQSVTFNLTLTQDVKYYFAMKTADEKPNWSNVSNIVMVLFEDNTPPATIINFYWSK